ncbi:CamS family sex pheromone protein [Bacillus marinisedimentorum]|uniref:CamS family sex pheromone protein n=1 Tax=Bacillus marinisedimentorum TaxID=1821260 RepID=UPI0008722AEA|nr:CamS family sex pheromone protein [Bacillus marinisedimentorum]
MLNKIGVAALAAMLLLSGCGPVFEKEEEVVRETEDEKEKAIIPKYKLPGDTYQTILPFQPSETRGLVNQYVYNRLDMEELERGLFRIARGSYPIDEYFFKEGHFLKEKDISKWIQRGITKDDPTEEEKPEETEDGNEDGQEGEDAEKQSELENDAPASPESEGVSESKSPEYLSYIMEHTYYQKNDDEQVELAGIVIGLSMNSVHYYKQAEGPPAMKPIPFNEMETQGKKIAAELVEQLRKYRDAENVPVTVALFREEKRESVVPGSFFAKADFKSGQAKPDEWQTLDEDYVFFPSEEAEENHAKASEVMKAFKKKIEGYFPDYTGVTGRGFYKGGKLQRLDIEIPIEFNGKTEIIGFTEYTAAQVMEHFPKDVDVRVRIASATRDESLVKREAGASKPFVHIYQ